MKTKSTRKNSKDLNCKGCGELVKNCGIEAIAVTCDKCVRKSMRNFIPNKYE